MNIIIAGCGKVGRTLAEQLNAEGHEITVIDIKSKTLQDVASRSDVLGIHGDCTSYYIQNEAGIKQADLLIAVTDRDEINMLACLIAKKAGNCQTIARVRSPQYSTEIGFIKEELGLSMSVNPEFAASSEIFRLIQIPSALEVDTFAKGRINLIRVIIPENSILNNMQLKDMQGKVAVGALVCIVERDKTVTIPGGDFILRAGDRISVTLPISEANSFLNKIGIKAKPIKKVLIAGGGMTSYYLAKMLIKARIQVKIIESDMVRCDELTELLPKAVIINGDATDKHLLMEEDIEHTDAVCALTDTDEENILLALFVNKMTHAKVMTRVNRNSYDDVIDEMPVGSIISPKEITAEYIIRYVRSMQNSFGSNVETLYRLADNEAEALEFNVEVGARVTQAPLTDLRIKKNTLICCISRNRKIIRPGGKDVIQPGDSVIVVTTEKGLNGIDEILDD